MKTLVFAVLLMGLICCTKEEVPVEDQKPNVYFLIKTDTACSNLPMTYVYMCIDGTLYHIHINDEYKQTCPIPLTNGVHVISLFKIFNDNATQSNAFDDVLLYYIPDVSKTNLTLINVSNGSAIEIKVKCNK